jgi:hypothetical protein
VERLFKVATVVLVALVIFFLFFWVISLASCTPSTRRYVQVMHPAPCKIIPVVESRTYGVYRIECPGKKPFTEKVRINER